MEEYDEDYEEESEVDLNPDLKYAELVLNDRKLYGVKGTDKELVKELKNNTEINNCQYIIVNVSSVADFHELIVTLFSSKIKATTIMFSNDKFISFDVDGAEKVSLNETDTLEHEEKGIIKALFQVFLRLRIFWNAEYLQIYKYNLGNTINNIALYPKLHTFSSDTNNIHNIKLSLNKELISLTLRANAKEFTELNLDKLIKLKYLDLSENHNDIRLINKKKAISLEQIIGDYHG